MNYELASGDEPVEVTVAQDAVLVTLGPLTVAYTTHRDQDAWDERQELIAALRASERPLLEAVDRHKFTHARDQAMIVLLAVRLGITPNAAAHALRLDATDDDLLDLEPEAGRDVDAARRMAEHLLSDCLRGHRWSIRGERIGPPPQKKCRAINLDTGEITTTHPVPMERATRESEWEWIDYNGMTVEEERPGQWWQPVGAVRELPIDPWSMELEYVAGR